MRRIEVITGDEHHRCPITPCVVDGHGGMLDSDRAVRGDCERLAGHLVVAVAHRNGLLLVCAGQKLGLGVTAIVDE